MRTGGRMSISGMLTLSRLLVVLGLVWAVISQPTMALLWIVVVMVADVLDGVIARRRGEDTDGRRVLDAAVDRLSIHAAFGTALYLHPAMLWIYMPLLIRDVMALSVGAYVLRRRSLLLLGGHWHKAASLSAAAFGGALVVGPSGLALTLGLLALATNYFLLLDYAGGLLAALEVDAKGRFRVAKLAGVQYLVRRLFVGERAANCERHTASLVPTPNPA